MYDVSVIIPVYNSSKYLRKCLDSIVFQTLENIEAIIIDDGSTDNSLQIAKEYEQNYPHKVKVYSVPNGGQGIARNFGVTKSSGEFIAFVDSDDYVDLKMYETLVTYARNHQSDLVICPYSRVDEAGNLLHTEMQNVEHSVTSMNSGPTNKLFRRDIWVNNSVRFSENLWYEDLEATLKYVFNCEAIGWIDEMTLYYYVQRSNSSINLYDERVNDIFKVIDNVYEYVKEKNLLEGHYQEIEYHCIMHLVFGHLSRCVGEKSWIKVHGYIKQTKAYLQEKFPTYYKNKYFKWENIKDQSLFMKVLKVVGLRLFYFNLFDSILLVYRVKMKFNKNIKRW